MSEQRTDAVIVTGAAGGIGAAIVRAFLANAANEPATRVIALDIEWPDAQAPRSDRAEHHTLDVSDASAVDRFVEALDPGIRIRTLINGAGIAVTGPALEVSAADATRLLMTNALGVMNMSLAVARRMRTDDGSQPTRSNDVGTDSDPQNDRSIITIASNAATTPRAGFSAYGASKAAASQFTRSLALELGPHGIRCNVLNPGTTITPMVERLWGGEDRRAEAVAGDPALFRTGIPLGRVATPDDVAAVAVFLAGRGARHITAEAFTVDGGATTP